MNHYRQLISEEIRSVQRQKDYCIGVMATKSLESWASKEYCELVKQCNEKLFKLQSRLPLAS